MKFRYAILTLGVLLILFSISGTANALVLNGDFTVEADCIEPAQTTWVLENDDSVTHTYTITAQGDYANWININGKWVGKENLKITLTASETKFLYAFIKADSCFIKPGSYEIPLTVSNEETIERVVIVEVLESRSVKLNAFENEITSGQCENVSFEFGIENTSKLDESVMLEVSGLDADWYSLSDESFTLEKNTSKTVSLEINAPCDAALETYEFEITAKLEKSYFETSEKFTYEILDAQEIEVLVDSIIVCNDEKSEAKIVLRNNGNFSDSLELNISDPEWVSLRETIVEIEAGAEKEITLEFTEHESEENVEILLGIYSLKFNKMTNKMISVNSEDCYNAEIGAFTLPESLCQEEANPVNATFDIANTGTKNIALNLTIEGVNAILSQESVEIMPSEVAKIAVVLDFSAISSVSPGLSIKAENPLFSTENAYSIDLVDCYALDIDASEFDGKITAERGKEPILVTLFMENEGSRTQGVDIAFEGPSWIYFEPRDVELGVGETQEVYFYISPSLEVKASEYESTIRITGFDFEEEVKLVVKVDEAGMLVEEETLAEENGDSEVNSEETVTAEETSSEESENSEDNGFVGTGLFLLANGGSIIIIVLFLVVVALLAYFSRSVNNTKSEVTESNETYTETDIPVKKTFTKKRTSKPKTRAKKK
ncbi:MAG: hypothetical protein V1672_03090 [Candidatus Diapherotrites archaeon]